MKILTSRPPPDGIDLAAARTEIAARASVEGFDAVGFTKPNAVGGAAADLRDYLARGHHGDMGWMEANADRRADPAVLWPQARSVVAVAQNYGPDEDPMAELARPDRGVVSVYARGRDYHDVVKGRLKRLAGWTASKFDCEVKVFVDTAPLMEKPLAQAAGVGFQGKHTNLVSREYGSWLFLGAMLTTLDLEADAPEANHCGTCRACLDICPTQAFPAPHQLDARRCISYLTIEHKGHIAPEFRTAIGNRIYGCDDCLAVCPWNKFAMRAADARLHARDALDAPSLAELARLDDADFRALFSGTAIKRTGRDRMVRNVMIAIGNSGDAALAPVVGERLSDTSPLVRAMAVWALSRLAGADEITRMAEEHLPIETDDAVLAEWRAALDDIQAIAP